jgi:hypothetical protein
VDLVSEPGWAVLQHQPADHPVQPGLTGTRAACALAAVTVAAGRLDRIGVAAAAQAGAVIWVAQDFGGIFTGQGTDPNSGLLLIVLAVAFWPVRWRAAVRDTEGDLTYPQPTLHR